MLDRHRYPIVTHGRFRHPLFTGRDVLTLKPDVEQDPPAAAMAASAITSAARRPRGTGT